MGKDDIRLQGDLMIHEAIHILVLCKVRYEITFHEMPRSFLRKAQSEKLKCQFQRNLPA